MKYYECFKNHTISITEFNTLVYSQRENNDIDSIWSLREAFAALARNKEWILGALHDLAISPKADFLSAQLPTSYNLFACDRFIIRINVWLPEKDNPETAQFENFLGSYDFPHDHNFQLLTANVFGPGYDTNVCQYDRTAIVGEIGEKVPISKLVKHRLGANKVFLYEKTHDIHNQLPPDEISMSLNYMPLSECDRYLSQYAFSLDGQTATIVGTPATTESREKTFLMILKELNAVGVPISAKSIDTIKMRSENHPNSNLSEIFKDVLSSIERSHNNQNSEAESASQTKLKWINEVTYHDVSRLHRENR